MTKKQLKYQKELMGIAVSPGIIIGKARLVDRSKVKIIYQYLIGNDQLNREVERFKQAIVTTENQLVKLKGRIPDNMNDHGFIIDSCLMMLKDSMLNDSTIKKILNEKINAEWALKMSLDEIREVFGQIDDEYISNRIIDVENVTEKVLRNLSGEEQESLAEINQRVIIVAHDLSPADTTELNINMVMGFLTDVGGQTSHTAIMAQALEIPAVVGLQSVTKHVKDGDLLIVDGKAGRILINPDDNAIIDYQERQLRHEEYRTSIAKKSHLPAITLDGHQIAVKANMEFVEEVAAVKDHGADGIGLFRTEFLYLRSRGLPTEDELYQDYREVAEIISPLEMTIRTLDLGGDKFASELEITKEINPALGLRAIRFCLKQPEIFKSQLRAILMASAYGSVQLMFPMISGLQEILAAQEILSQVKKELDRKHIDYDRNIKTGIMIEVPSAVTMAEVLAQHVDFFSIGTNDLIQYALAIDRINEQVAYMYQPFHPAILRMIEHVVNSAKKNGIRVSLCGEMAGDPLCISILLGLGIEELSVNSSAIPLVKRIIRSLSIKDAQKDFRKIITLNTAQEVKTYIQDRMVDLIPELQEKGYLDT